MRDDVLMSLVRRAQEDPAFRAAALADPEQALAEHGFELDPDELAAVRAFHAETAALPQHELDARLASAGAQEAM